METARSQAEAVRAGEVTARSLAETALAHIDADNATLNAFVVVDPEAALRSADAVDAKVAKGLDPGLLAGVPIGVKDLDRVAGMKTSYGSLVRKDDPPNDSDSIHVARLRGAGAVILGMTASPEFGTMGYTRSKAWGTTRNPWDTALTPGGSSGGSAAAVASGMLKMSTASDGGGSTRIPAAFSGLVGFKCSYGRVPNAGAQTSQTGVKGVLTTNVGDAARHLDVASGPNDRDRTSLPAPGFSYEAAIEELPVKGLRVAWSHDLGFAAVDPEVAACCEVAAERLVAESEMVFSDYKPKMVDAARTWSGVGAIDLWKHMEQGDWPERGDLLVPAVRKAYEITEKMSPPDYVKILAGRSAIELAVAEMFEEIDVLLTPATAVTAFIAEGPPPNEIDGQSVHPAGAVPFTMLANMAWNPAISVPAGMSDAGMPIGLQIMGRRHADDVVLRLARIFEQMAPWPATAPGWSGS